MDIPAVYICLRQSAFFSCVTNWHTKNRCTDRTGFSNSWPCVSHRAWRCSFLPFRIVSIQTTGMNGLLESWQTAWPILFRTVIYAYHSILVNPTDDQSTPPQLPECNSKRQLPYDLSAKTNPSHTNKNRIMVGTFILGHKF